MSLQRNKIFDHYHLPGPLHLPVTCQLPPSLRPCLGRRMPSRQGIVLRHKSSYLCSDDEADATPPQFGERYGPSPPVRLIGHSFLTRADGGDRQGEVPVPFHGVHAEI